jgi:hypothetical protein
MREARGDLWAMDADVVVITTNGVVKQNGACVMGRGCAQQARDRFAGIDRKLGGYIRQHGNRAFNLGTWRGTHIASMPVKHRWDQQADPQLIVQSARQLTAMADKFGWQRIAVPRPGCGNGSLNWSDVRPLLLEVLDDRFTVVTW